MKKWAYLCLLLFLWSLYLYIIRIELFAISFVLTIIPLISYLLFYFERNNYSFEITTSPQITRGEQLKIIINYKRKKKGITFSFIQVDLLFTNRFFGTEKNLKVFIPIDKWRNSAEYSYYFTEIGVVDIKIASIIYHDFLFLWQKNITPEIAANFCVYPQITNYQDYYIQSINKLMETRISPKTIQAELSDDYTLREYLPTDLLRHIHHKISYKMQKYYVKDYLYKENQYLVCYLDLQGDFDIVEQTIVTFYNLGKYCFEQLISLEVHWLNSRVLEL